MREEQVERYFPATLKIYQKDQDLVNENITHTFAVRTINSQQVVQSIISLKAELNCSTSEAAATDCRLVRCLICQHCTQAQTPL